MGKPESVEAVLHAVNQTLIVTVYETQRLATANIAGSRDTNWGPSDE